MKTNPAQKVTTTHPAYAMPRARILADRVLDNPASTETEKALAECIIAIIRNLKINSTNVC
jgi:hypothetical protein